MVRVLVRFIRVTDTAALLSFSTGGDLRTVVTHAPGIVHNVIIITWSSFARADTKRK